MIYYLHTIKPSDNIKLSEGFILMSFRVKNKADNLNQCISKKNHFNPYMWNCLMFPLQFILQKKYYE